jgi:putative ABC transport system permease protein
MTGRGVAGLARRPTRREWRRARRGWRPPIVHWPSIRGRARADAGPLALVGVVVAVVALLAGTVPPLLHVTAQDAVEDAVRRAGGDAELAVSPPWDPDYGPHGGRVRDPDLAAVVDDLLDTAAAALDPRLRAALRAPTAVVSSPRLDITDGSVLRTFQLTYVTGGPQVTWIAGGPPRAAPAVANGDVEVHVEVPLDAPPWPVQIGLSEVDASALRLRPGDRIPLEDEQKNVKNVVVSGIFRPADGADPAWQHAPWLLRPVAGADGVGSTRFGGLLSPESLPDARLALEWNQFDPIVRFEPDPQALAGQSPSELIGILVRLKATSGSSGGYDTGLKWQTQLDAVLRTVESRVAAATAQASVLLIAVLTAAILVLLLAAELLVRRRAPALAVIRQRGAALPDLGIELLLESAAVALAAAALGLGAARLLGPGASWGWAVPVVVAAAASAPGLGMFAAARSTGGRRAPANRAARHWHHRTARLRRGALEAAAVAAAAAALVALHQRGVLPAGGVPGSTQDGDTTLPAGAPALGILAGALLLLRLLPGGTSLALRQALRARGSLPVFGAARAAATAARVLPPLVLTASAALACFALTVHATADRGLADGAWRTVGADARLDLAPTAAADTAGLARRVAAAPDVRQVVTAQVTDRARVIADGRAIAPRLVVVAAADLQRLLAATPLPDAPALARLAAPEAGDIPALVRSNDGSLRPGMRLELPRTEGRNIHLVAVGTAPAVGDAEDIVVVDAATIAAAGVPMTPNTVWVTGPGAAQAVANSGTAGTVVLRTDVQRDRRSAPLAAGLLWLAWVSAATLLSLGLLGLAVGAATSAPERWQTLTRLRTLGLRPRDGRWISAAELLPPVLLATVAGPLLGALLARLTLGPLALALITGQASEPTLVVPWWEFAVVIAALAAAFAVVVPVESALRRRRRVSDVLRAGG